MTHMLIPDSIEPIVGYKYLCIVREGGPEGDPRLISAYFGDSIGKVRMGWPVDAPAEAECHRTHHENTVWTLEALRSPPKDRPWGRLDDQHGEKPQVVLGAGLDWYWVAEPHLPPVDNCSCGIYAVSDPKRAQTYRQDHRALVRIAQWGRTVPAANGARSQYACVTGVLESTCPSFSAADISRAYNIPLIAEEEGFRGASDEEIQKRVQALAVQLTTLRDKTQATHAALVRAQAQMELWKKHQQQYEGNPKFRLW